MQIITSKENENVKKIRKLQEKKYRDNEKSYLIEGINLIKEAIQEKAKIKKIVICEECLNTNCIDKQILYEIEKYDCIYVTKQVFASMTEVKNPQGILAVIQKENEEQVIDYSQDIILILDDLQDPGNIGTILRTVDSVGLNQVIISKKCGDIYNPKVIRSTMGAIFRVNGIES